jgi:hypothetical protein
MINYSSENKVTVKCSSVTTTLRLSDYFISVKKYSVHDSLNAPATLNNNGTIAVFTFPHIVTDFVVGLKKATFRPL